MNITLLKLLTIDATNESYPEPEWLRVCTIGSKIEMYTHAVAIGIERTIFEGEVKVIKIALLILIPRIHNFNRAVISSKVAI